MKTIIIAVSAAVLIAAAPIAVAQSASATTPAQQHKISARHHSALTGHPYERGMPAARARASHPNAFGYAAPQSHLAPEIEASRQAGGGGGGGGSGM